ncbi:MAG: c-type cytochrome biogenesis protein CcsB [Deltaproteobacteria bacterium]|nr:c-type cytochrome biogenesis protein CcsB [Deltaproteobacteria bacterium]
MIGIVLFKTALTVYLVCAVVYAASLWVRRVLTARVATWLMLAALVIHTFSLASRWFIMGMSPVIGLHDSLSFFAWAMAATYLALQLRTKTRVLGAFISPVICLIMVVASVELGGDVGSSDALQGSLVTFHVIFSVTGEALFVVASCAGLMYLIQDDMLKKKKEGSLIRLFPSLRDLDKINHLCLSWGFTLLTFGILAGSGWARIVWGSHWQWDPKQIWTLLAWGLYGFLLHQRLVVGWQGRKAALWSLIVFVFLIALLIFGKIFFQTIHSFV